MNIILPMCIFIFVSALERNENRQSIVGNNNYSFRIQYVVYVQFALMVISDLEKTRRAKLALLLVIRL